MRRIEMEKVAPLGKISRHTFRASPLARHTISRSGMSLTGFLGVPLPCNPIWNPERTLYAVRTGSWVGASDIPLSADHRAFALQDLEEGCKTVIHQEISAAHAPRAKSGGAIISSAFVVWRDGSESRKGRFFVNLSKQSNCWKNGTVKMESLSEFAMEMQKGDHLISMDKDKGCRQCWLHPSMRDLFVFRNAGKYYQCVALPFGWARSPLWFTMLMAIFVGELRRLGYRTLAYLDDFLLASSSPGVVSTNAHCAAAAARVENLMKSLGLIRHPSKGVWTGTTVIEHLGVKIDSVEMKFFIAERKVQKFMHLSKDLLRDV